MLDSIDQFLKLFKVLVMCGKSAGKLPYSFNMVELGTVRGQEIQAQFFAVFE